MTTTDWVKRANCRGLDPGLFVTQRGEPVDQAQAICAGCAVRAECLAHAMDTGPTGASHDFHVRGVWGNTTHNERKLMRRRRREATGLSPAS